ncbi:MAG TPA: hypothetical protein VML95_04140 [Longimicrobiales bacterium]|nr:hypothetical protein [Longimicrobiales bacterium]
MSPQEFWTRLEAARSSLRRGAGFAAALAAALALPALLLVAWIAALSPGWDRPSPWPLVALVAAAAGAALVATAAVRRWLRPLDGSAVAVAAERARGLPPGSLRGALELRAFTPDGTSESLARLSERRLVDRVGLVTPRELGGGLAEGVRRRVRRLGGAALGLGLAVAVLGASDPQRARQAWAPLLQPLRALTPPELPSLAVAPGDLRVTRGDTFRVSVRAPQRRVVTLHWRAQGELPGRARLAVRADSAGRLVGPVEAPLSYWVSAPDGATSDTFRVEPLDPLLLSALTVDVAYPAYLGRAPERFEGEPPPLVLPEGSVVRVRGVATRPLGAAKLRGTEGAVSLTVFGDRFDGRLRPARSGAWAWELADRDGAASPASPPPLQIAVVPDGAPWVEIRFPGEDTEAGPDMQQAVVAHAGDDHGLLRAALVSWRVDASGERDSVLRAPIELAGTPPTAALRTVLRAAGRRVLPGGRLEYFVEVTDDGPRAQTARSRTLAFRFPGADELRDRVGEEADELLHGADDLSRMARDLERATRELQRRMDSGAIRDAGRSGGGQEAGEPDSESTLDFERAEAARAVLDRQEELLEQAAALRDRMEDLGELSRSAGLSDPEFQRRLEELRDLMDEVAPQEMRDQLDRLREALDELDATRTEEALRALAEQQEQLQERLQQSLELLQRAAAEQEMRALADEARKLSARQQALSDALRDSALSTPPRAAESRDSTDAAPDGTPPPNSAPSGQDAGLRDDPPPGSERAGEDAAPDPAAEDSAGAAAAPADPGDVGSPAGDEAGDSGFPADSGSPAEAGSPVGMQADLAKQAGDLAERLGGLEERLRRLGEATASERSGEAGSEAQAGGQAMRDAAREAAGGQRDAAAEAGQRGAGSMDRAADLLDSARDAMTQAWRDDTTQALEEATRDALSLAERESELLDQMQQARESGSGASEQDMSDMRGEQAAVQEGLESIARNLSEAASRSAMVDRQVGQALGEAMKNVQESASAMEGGDGRPRLPIQETQAAVDAMNDLALSLVRNARQVGQSPAGTGLEEAMRQLAEAASQQGRINNEASALSPEDLSAAVLSRQARRLSERQQDIARQLQGTGESLGGSEDLLGDVEAMAEEAERLAQELAGGRIDRRVLERQEQLFHRMLDAGRSLEREELGDERTAAAASEFERVDPGALDPALTSGGARYPAPSSALLQRLSPGYRRLILDYFDLINRVDPAAPERSPAPARRPPLEGSRDR